MCPLVFHQLQISETHTYTHWGSEDLFGSCSAGSTAEDLVFGAW